MKSILLSVALAWLSAWSGGAVAAVTYQAAGTAVAGITTTGVGANPAWPAHAVNDIALLFVESTGGQPVTLSVPNGFAPVPNSPQTTGSGTAGTQLTVFWARATSAAMPAPRIVTPSDHFYARIITFRGVINTGNPWDATAGGVKAAATTSVSVTGVTTTVPNTLVVQAVARDNDNAAAAFSGQTNASLTGITERLDAGTTNGNGGGLGVWAGVKATAGATGNTTATVTSSINAFITIALKPQQAAPVYQAAGGAANNATSVSPAWPVHAIGDIALLFVESGGGEAVTLTTANGFAVVPNSPQITGAGTAGTRLTVFWARATSTGMLPPTVTVPAIANSHIYARIITYRNVVGAVNPWDITGGGIKTPASTSVSVSGVNTTVPNTRIVQAVARHNDSNAAAFSAETNANLTGIAERSDAGTNTGAGGGFAVWDGVMAATGATGNTTATVTSSINAFLTIALAPTTPAAPVYQGIGGAVTTGLNWPAHAIDDVALLFVESPGGQIPTLADAAGFVEVANSPQATGAGTAGTRLTVFWARATSAAMAGPTLSGPTDHVYARILTYRGVITTGNPWDVTGGGVKAAASTSVSVSGVTTTVPNTRVVQAVARGNDNAAAAFSAETNANLTGIAERSDAGTATGNGGGFVVWDGAKATAGATGPTTATVTSSINAFLTIALKPPVVGPDHYELSLPTASVACLASPVTVTACTDSVSPCTNKYIAASGTTATLATSAGTLGATTVTFDATGVATTTLSYPASADGATATVTLSAEQIAATNPRKCCPDGVGCAVANSCATTFKTAGFIFSAAADAAETTVPTQIAGTDSSKFWLRAVKTNTTTKACEAALSGASNVDFAYQCNNPTACYVTSPPACGAGSGYFCLTPYSSDGTTAQTPQPAAANPNSGVTSYASVTMNFDANGNAPFTFRYADVGQVKLWANKAAGGSLLTSLSGVANPGGPFVVKPHGFKLSGLTCAPADQTSAAAGAFCAAGGTFTGTAIAAIYDAGQPNNLGAAAPSFGRETTAQTVTFAPDSLVMPTTAAGGTLSAFTTSTVGSFSGAPNAATATLAWPNVGTITIKPTISYLGTGDLTAAGIADSVAFAGNVGRFHPYTFALNAGSTVNPACGGFTYMDQPGLGIAFTLEARNKAGTLTSNYLAAATGGYDNDPGTAGNQVGSVIIVAENNDAGTDLASRLSGLGTTAWAGGQYAVGATGVTFARAAAPDGAYDALLIGARVTDADATLAGMNLRATTTGACTTGTAPATDCDAIAVGTATKVRYGRLRLLNVNGSELLPLPLPVVVQYYESATKGWQPSTGDTCSTLVPANFAFDFPPSSTNYLTACETAVTVSGSPPTPTVSLAAPGKDNQGWTDITINLGATVSGKQCSSTGGVGPDAISANMPWLQFDWASSGAADPKARATFGVYRSGPVLFRRESY